MFLLFSHKLTPEQVADAKNSLGVQRFISLPEELQRRWNAIDPLQPSLISYLEPFFTWLKINSSPGDFVFVQGDFGATFLLVSFCLSHNLIPIYATTERQVVEQKLPDGSIKLERIFKHKLFRRYELFKV